MNDSLKSTDPLAPLTARPWTAGAEICESGRGYERRSPRVADCEENPVRDIRVAAAQFEHSNGDKAYNLSRIEELTRRAANQGAEIVSFHECSVSGYTFLQHLSRAEISSLAEPVPDGPTVEALVKIARDLGVVVMAGLVEIDPHGRLFNCYVTVGPRRIHHQVPEIAHVYQSFS